MEDLKQMQHAQAFEQIIKDTVEQEAKYDALHMDSAAVPKQENGDVPNSKRLRAPASAASRSGIVLTLPGNAPTAKQLFSSMQRSYSGDHEIVRKGELAVDEVSLPIGITATRIMAAPVDESKSGPTFEETFAAPYILPALHPPRVHRRSTTRDETIKWEFRDTTTLRNKKGGYTVQSLPVAEWLGYGGLETKDEPSSPREKRKLRDRTLSSGESSQPLPNKASLEEALAKEEEALFRKAYSSFAPSCDNSKAIVSEEVKSMVWWHKVGQKRYQETFAIDPALLDEPLWPLAASLLPAKTSEEDFSTVLEDLENLEALNDESLDEQPVRDKTDIDEVLREISELLQTLSSYQRIRNASLQSSASAARTPISPAPTLASRNGRPDGPGEDEFVTYEALRREIVYLILQLPPYAVAKLNGDQIAELGVSKLIKLDGRNVKGTMEEDQVARLARHAAQLTAQGLATRSASGGQHYSSTNQRTPAIGQAANTRYGQTQYGLGRTPMSQPPFNRSISNQAAFNTPAASAARPGYGQPNQYSRSGAPQSGFGQANGQNYYQQRQVAQGTPGYGGYNQYNSATPTGQHQRPSYPTSSQPLAQFQQRSHSAAQNAVAYQTAQAHTQQHQSPFNRTASPPKPASHQPPLQPSPLPRGGQQFPPPPPASDRATPVNYPSQPQTPVNGVPEQQANHVAQRTSETPQPQPAQSVQANGHA